MDSLATDRSRGRRRGWIACALAATVAALTMATAAPASAVTDTVRAGGASGEAAVGIDGLSGVSAVSAGGGFDLVLLNDGTVKAWGANDSGQLGDGTLVGSATPVSVSGLTGVTAISAGWGHSLARLSDGTVKAWGSGGDGALGQGAFSGSDVPVTVSGLSGVTAVSGGSDHSLALLSDGTVMGWGKNEFGDLGSSAPEKTDVPVAVPGLSSVAAISAGRFFNLAVLSDGKVMGWGYDGNGELGNFTGPCETWPGCATPVELGELSGVTTVSAGLAHGLALLNDGTARAWGNNTQGQLGDGTFEGSTAAVPVSGISGATAIAAGWWTGFAVQGDGSTVAWGHHSALPQPVDAFGHATGIAAGSEQSLAAGPFTDIGSMSPTSGVTSGGTSVTITGENFTGATSVKFGTLPATGFTVDSNTSITAVAPPQAAGMVNVSVTGPVVPSLESPSDHFTYVAPPAITAKSPASGSAGGGTKVTISGTSLGGATEVKFGAIDATSFTVSYGSSLTKFKITAYTPAEPVGTVDVTVTTPYGTSATSSKDRYTFKPAVTSVSPTTGSAEGGTTVTVIGAGFAVGSSGTTFRFGTSTSHSVNCTSSTSCTVIAPAHVVGTVDVKATVNKVASAKNAPGDQFTYD